ncbi:hypothetical protein I316_05388 [Kwoniella heveanensis BCC8398]|uniref:Glycosyltransferase 61 catalytic domain-containing protein n=1 Tax=Kwoniella heveanensis BCC8398 TaxID=1296120 RepID=A0A1B9GPQ2_9TREE|nr:hypothetical protein I316_05388 [Kwoniella heveanensis BCC8398]
MSFSRPHTPQPIVRPASPRRPSATSLSRTNSRDPSPTRTSAHGFDLRLPLLPPIGAAHGSDYTQSSSPGDAPRGEGSSSSSTGSPTSDPLVRSLAFFRNSLRMSPKTNKRGNKYIFGAVAVLAVFGLWHVWGSGAGSGLGGWESAQAAVSNAGSKWEGVGFWPSSMKWGKSRPAGSGLSEVDKTTFVDLQHGDIPETVWVKGVAGFNYFQNLYLWNGTFIAVVAAEDAESMPNVATIMSDHPTDDGRFPKAKEDRWKVLIKGQDELEFLGGVAVRKAGVSMFFNDEKGKKSVSFLKHYFHFIGEVFLGAWRVLTTAGDMELPQRLMYRTTPDDWRDRAGLTTWFQQSVMPNTAVEESPIWEDRIKSGMTFLYDKITISDRWAAHAKGKDTYRFNKMTADMLYLDAPMNWMDPLRDSMKLLVQTKGCSVYRENPDVPIVLYINRQLTGRRLLDNDAKVLVEEMQKLESEGVIQWIDAQMETYSRIDQFCLALKADVIMGVHGNGLSHALWMKPGSAVLEFMFPGGFARDYATVAELMRHDYYAIHKDEVFTKDKWLKPDGWGVGANQGFHSTNIPLDGKWVADLIRTIAEEKKGMVEP